MTEKEHWLAKYLKFIKWQKSLIEGNLKRAEKQLEDRKKLAKERGIKEPIVVPEGYIDIDKELREMVESSKKQLEEHKKIIEEIYEASYFIK